MTSNLVVSGTTLAMNGDRFRCVATNGFSSDTTSNAATLSVITAAKAAWLQNHFTSAELADSNISGDNADPDFDMINNFYEYSFDLDPKLGQGNFLTPELVDGKLRLVFQAPRDELDYKVEGSTALQSWSTQGVTIQQVGTEVTATYDPPGGTKGFLHIVVTPKAP